MKNHIIHQRKSIRLPGYDYTQSGSYFITMVTWHREYLFGVIDSGAMQLNEFGKIAANAWQWLAIQYPYIELGSWCVMPNHVHGVITIDCRVASRRNPTITPRRIPTTIDSQNDPMDIKIKPLGQLIGVFKTISAKQINVIRKSQGIPVWQRNFYEHIIRDEKELESIQTYIEFNPRNWNNDKEYR